MGDNIVWVDMEMTGLNIDRDRIMEIAFAITDSDLNIKAELPSIVINQPSSLLNAMDETYTTTHKKVRCSFFVVV